MPKIRDFILILIGAPKKSSVTSYCGKNKTEDLLREVLQRIGRTFLGYDLPQRFATDPSFLPSSYLLTRGAFTLHVGKGFPDGKTRSAEGHHQCVFPLS